MEVIGDSILFDKLRPRYLEHALLGRLSSAILPIPVFFAQLDEGGRG